MLLQVFPAVQQSAFDQFLAQPIDVVMFQILLYVGWVPILAVFVWGVMHIYLDYRQGVFSVSLKWVLLAIDVPRETEQSPKAMENVFASLFGCKSAITWREKWILGKFNPRFSFEIVSDGGYIQYYIRTMTRWRDIIEAGIYAQYPDAEIREVEDYIHDVPSNYPDEEWDMWGTEMKLKEANYFPIRTFEDFEHSMSQELKDPLAIILEQLGRMKPGEKFWLQVMVEICEQDWKKEGDAYVEKAYGIPPKAKKGIFSGVMGGLLSWPSLFLEQTIGVSLTGLAGVEGEKPVEEDFWKVFKITLQEKAVVEGVSRKVSKYGLKTKFRLLYFGRKEVYNKQARTGIVKGMLLQYNNLDMNGFGLFGPQTPKDDYFWQEWTYPQKQSRLVKAYKGRSFSIGATASILNTEELASIYHFPTILIKAPLVKKTEARKAEPPVGLAVSFEEEGLPSGPLPAMAEEAAKPKEELPPVLPFLAMEDIPGPELTPPSPEGAAPVRPSRGEEEEVPEPESIPEPSLPSEPDATRPSTPSRAPSSGRVASVRSAKGPAPRGLSAAGEGKPPEVRAARPGTPSAHNIPPAIRVLIDPTVELEDVGLTDPQADETPDAPGNLPL